MDYTRSDAHVVDPGTGNRMHQNTAPVTTAVEPDDMNMVAWSLMEVLKKAGVAGAEFDKTDPASYTRLLDALIKLRRAPHLDDLIPAGTSDHTPYFNAMMAAGGYWRVGPGPYTVSAQINWTEGTKVWFDATVINHNTTTASTVVADEIDDWGCFGSLTLMGPGKANGTAKAFFRRGGNRFEVHNVVAMNIAGWGFYEEPGSLASGPRGDQGNWVNCRSISCWRGREDIPGTGAEYNLWVNYTGSGNGIACITAAGNQTFMGGQLVDNDNGFLVNGGSNNAHGKVIGMAINHNTGFNIKTNGVTNGQIFSGVTCYGDSTSSGIIHLVNSKGITFSGGILDASIACDGAIGYSLFANNLCPDSPAAQVHGGTSPRKVIYVGNYTFSGAWGLNDRGGMCHVSARRSASAQVIGSGPLTATLVHDDVVFDTRSCYNPANGLFTAPWDGTFCVSSAFRLQGVSLANAYVFIYVNNSPRGVAPVVAYVPSTAVCNATAEVDCLAGDTIDVRLSLLAGPTSVTYDSVGSLFTVTAK